MLPKKIAKFLHFFLNYNQTPYDWLIFYPTPKKNMNVAGDVHDIPTICLNTVT